MDNGLAVSGFEESLIVQAHEFFQLQMRKWIDDGAGLVEQRMDALETATTAMLQMVVIDLDPKDDPNIIFETLNARGTPLEQSDLIKNFVLSEGRDRESSMWGKLDEEWWRTEDRQGRLYRRRLDILFNYWLTMRTKTEVPPSKVFDYFRKSTKDKPINTVMSEVNRDLENYRKFEENKGCTPEEKLFYYRTNVMQVGVIIPIVLLLFLVEHRIRIRAFRVLESFLVRRMICRKTTKEYNRLTLDLVGKLQECGGLEAADKVIVGFLKEQTAYSREWPKDDTVADCLESLPLYRLLTRGRLRLVLEGIEDRMRSPKAEQKDVPKNLTIEHLMPQSWEHQWPLPDGSDETTAHKKRNELVHSIGNLTLVTQRLNSSASNAPWELKREELRHSVLSLNNELISEPRWDEDSIRSRSRQMAKLVAKCWPGPDSQEWES